MAGIPLIRQNYLKNEYLRYIENSPFWGEASKAWDWLNQNTTGNNIAYTGRPVPFPLYGSKFKNNVFYVSLNQTEPALIHKYKNSYYIWENGYPDMHADMLKSNNYRGNADYAVWLENLKRRRAEFLFVYALHRLENYYHKFIFPIEDRWASEYNDHFTLLFSTPMVHIYKVN